MNPLFDLSQRQVIMFDLDGTLVDSARDLYRAMNLTLADLGRECVTEQQVRVWIGKGAAQLCRCVIEYQDEVFQSTAHEQLLARFLQVYQQNLCVDTTIYTGVVDFLDFCQAQDKTLVCITNKPYQAAVALLDQLGLLQRFALVLGGDSLAQRKPDPEPLLYAMRKFTQTTSQMLMIGDSRNDVEAARAAQIDCIVLSYGYNHGEDINACRPQVVIDSLAELIPISM